MAAVNAIAPLPGAICSNRPSRPEPPEKAMHKPNIQLPIYLDYQATTPTDPRVVEEMLPYFTTKFGNPHSRSHSYGWEAEEGVEKARGQVAKLIGADEKEVIFTSGATESNNLAIRGVAEFYKDRKNHIVTTMTEHKCVLDTCRHLEQNGFEVTYLPVQKNGLIDLDQLRAAITDKTVVVSIMAVNNEIGVIQPLAEIGKICREKKCFFHTDAAQAAGKIPLDVEAMNIDLMSLSGHKIYGPKGIGALWVLGGSCVLARGVARWSALHAYLEDVDAFRWPSRVASVPLRSTKTTSSDGFPMFSSDGKKLVFGSNRNAAKQGDTNVFIADWVE